MEFEFLNPCKEKVAPLGVTVDIVIRDATYYIVFDATHSVITPEKWQYYFGMPYEALMARFVKEVYKPVEVETPADGIAECRIGTLFDILESTND